MKNMKQRPLKILLNRQGNAAGSGVKRPEDKRGANRIKPARKEAEDAAWTADGVEVQLLA